MWTTYGRESRKLWDFFLLIVYYQQCTKVIFSWGKGTIIVLPFKKLLPFIYILRVYDAQALASVSVLQVVVLSRSVVANSVTPWTTACQTSLSFTISQSLLKFMSVELVVPSSHLILCRPLLLLPSIFPSIRVFPVSQVFPSGGQTTGASASASVLPMNIQRWVPSGLTGLISLLFKGLWGVFSSTTFQRNQFFGTQPALLSNPHIRTWLLENP